MSYLPLLTFLVGFFVSILSSIAGGGGGLLVSPYLLLIGLPPQVVAGTPKLAGVGLALGSLKKFSKASLFNAQIIRVVLPISVLSGVLGPIIIMRTPSDVVQNIILFATIAISLFTFFIKNIGLQEKKLTRPRVILGSISYLMVSTLQSAFSSGIGTFNMFVFMGVFGLPALKANATKRLTGLASIVIGLIGFSRLGFIDWPHGLALLAGMYFGSQVGAHIALKRGSALVKNAFIVVTLVTAGVALLKG